MAHCVSVPASVLSRRHPARFMLTCLRSTAGAANAHLRRPLGLQYPPGYSHATGIVSPLAHMAIPDQRMLEFIPQQPEYMYEYPLYHLPQPSLHPPPPHFHHPPPAFYNNGIVQLQPGGGGGAGTAVPLPLPLQLAGPFGGAALPALPVPAMAGGPHVPQSLQGPHGLQGPQGPQGSHPPPEMAYYQPPYGEVGALPTGQMQPTGPMLPTGQMQPPKYLQARGASADP